MIFFLPNLGGSQQKYLTSFTLLLNFGVGLQIGFFMLLTCFHLSIYLHFLCAVLQVMNVYEANSALTVVFT